MAESPATSTTPRTAARFADIELSLIRQINALATPLSVNLGIGEPNLEPDETLRAMAARAAQQPWQYSANAGFLSLRKKIAEGTNPADLPGVIKFSGGHKGVEVNAILLAPNPITKDNLSDVIDAGWISKEEACAGVAAGAVAACS